MYKVLGVGLITYLSKTIGKSLIEKKLSNRLIEEMKSILMITLFWTVIILIVAFIGKIFDLGNKVSWLIDFIFITYVIQGFIGVLSAIRIVKSYSNSVFVGIVKNFFSISIIGIIQSILIPLFGLFVLYLLLTLLRQFCILNFGGGFFNWVYGNIMALVS